MGDSLGAIVRRWWPLALVVAWAAFAWLVQPRSPLVAITLPGVSAIIVFVVLLIALVVALLRKVERPRIIVLAVSLLVCFAVGILSVAPGPFGLRMLRSREQLHAAAILVVRGTPPEVPARIGGFDFSAIDLDGGIVRFRMYEGELGEQGIAFFPTSIQDSRSGGYTYIPIAWHNGQWYIYNQEVDGS